MSTAYLDLRTSRDFLAATSALLALTLVLALACVWYVKPPRVYPVPPLRCRVTYVRENADRTALAPIHFSLPSKIGFSRTVQPGDPRLATSLGPRIGDVRYWPRVAGETALPAAEAPPVPVFQPWSDDAPVFAPVAGTLQWTILTERLDGDGPVTLPPELEEAARWPVTGAWTAVVRMESGPDGRVSRLFMMPPAPEAGVASRLESLLRRARFRPPGQFCRLKISRVQASVGAPREGANP